jgi:uncharacterized membrane protein
LNIITDQDARSDHKTFPAIFVAVALIFGTILVFLTPPFQVTDEFWHFFRAYQISLGEMVAQKQDDTQGGTLPLSLLTLSNRFARLPYHPAQRTSWTEIVDAGKIPLEPGRPFFFHFPSTANYSPLVYAPQAIAIAIGRWAGLRPLELLYFAREANLLAYCIAGYFTLRFAPALKRAIFIVMLMPMSLSLAASVSADAVTIAICLLFTSLVWDCAVDDAAKVDARNKIAIIALSIGVVLCKFAYAPLILLVLLIPASRFGGKGRRLKFVAALIIVNLAVSLAWLSQTAGAGLIIRPDRPDVNAAQQLAFIRGHPLALLPALARGFTHDGPLILQSFVGYLGWLDNPVSPLVVAIYLIVLAAACWPIVNDPPPLPRWRLTLLAALVFACVLIFAFLNYLFWTPVGFPQLQGLQGRYFIPLGLAMLILAWGILRRSPKLIPPLNNSIKLDVIASALCICGGFYTLFLVFTRYFAS